MRLKSFHYAILTIALLVVGASAAAAQTGPLRGIILLRGADGKEAPLPEAQVDIFRTDLPGKFSTKATKKGEFQFAGVPLTGTYVIAASGPGAAPSVLPNARPSDKDYTLILSPGDGKRLTDVEAKALAKGGATAAAGGAAAGGGRESAEDKKKREEYEAKIRDIEEKNKKITSTNEVLSRTFKAGSEALKAGDDAGRANNPEEAKRQYAIAIAQYSEGLAADPEQPALLTNKAAAQKALGVLNYNSSIKLTDQDAKTAALEAARTNFKQASETANTAVTMLKAQTPPTDPAGQANYTNNKYAATSVWAESMRLFVTKVDPTQVDAGIAAYQEYLALELDPAKKAKGQLELAGMVFDSNAFDKALVEYQKVLADQPDNPDALVRSGMALFNLGFMTNDKTKFQDAANFLQRFVDKAPDTHPFKADAVAVLDTLKKEQNVKPVKTAAPPPKKRG